MLDSRVSRGILSRHRGNFGKPIQEGVSWDAAKPEGHAAPPPNVDLPECDCQLLAMELAGRRSRPVDASDFIQADSPLRT